jgi:hypothetical protein
MRLLPVVAAALLAAGCLSSSPTTSLVRQDDSEPPPAPAPQDQLREIAEWARADDSPMAVEALEKAEASLRVASRTDAQRKSVSRAWTHAQAASKPGLDPAEKKRLWTLCANELTHGPSGG